MLSSSASYGAGAVSPPEARLSTAPKLAPGADIPAQWWQIFHNRDLDALVAEALNNSPTVAAARAGLRAAQEQVKAQRGAYVPTVSASIEPTRQSFPENLASPLSSGEYAYSLTTSQVSVSYTPDLFGANRRSVESLVAQSDQQRFELEAARLTLASNVAQAAIQDALLRAEIEINRSIVADQQEILASFRRQYSLGQASKGDLAAQDAALAQSEAALPPLEKQFRVNRDLLAALLGRTPAELPPVNFTFQSLTLPDELPLSLPAQLVEHRPDVRISEAQLRAASAQIGVARAQRFPNFQIGANAGNTALGLVPGVNGASYFWTIAATLTQTIFDGGTLLHHERAAKANYDQAAAQYRATIVGAFQNTADVLHALWTDGDALNKAQLAENAARNSLEIERQQFALGDVSRLALISAQQADAQARLTSLQAEANRYNDVVALFQALGGGWWNRTDAAHGE